MLDLLAIEDESLTALRKRSFVENPSLKVREGKDGQIFVQGLTKHNITRYGIQLYVLDLHISYNFLRTSFPLYIVFLKELS